MIDLTKPEEIKSLDPQNTFGSTEMLPEQLEKAWEEVQTIEVPQNYSTVSNIVFCGMGASIYGALVVKSLFGPDFPFPIELVSDYHLPKYVNSNTLVVLTSYSGTTEEVLSCAKEAKEKGAKMLVLTKGGALADFAKENSVPAYVFDGALNPSGVPRLGNGYTIIGLMGLLHKAGIIALDTEKLKGGIEHIRKNKDIIVERAMHDAHSLIGKIPVVFMAGHLSGNAQILRNQFNETSKTFSAYFLIPDLNHHLMEGLQFPAPSDLKFMIFESGSYSPKIQKRVSLTMEVVQQNNHTILEYVTRGTDKYQDFMEVLSLGSYTTLYLGLLNNQNPAVNPWVDYFKKKLSE
ncbi:MAG: SIS domain-containing protein [Candidatus Levyibacteriota bacterium]